MLSLHAGYCTRAMVTRVRTHLPVRRRCWSCARSRKVWKGLGGRKYPQTGSGGILATVGDGGEGARCRSKELHVCAAQSVLVYR